MSEDDSYQTRRWTKHFEEIDLEIARLAVMMDIPILNPGVIDRILGNDASVCGKEKPKAFAELRAMLMMHAADEVKAIGALGALEADEVVRGDWRTVLRTAMAAEKWPCRAARRIATAAVSSGIATPWSTASCSAAKHTAHAPAPPSGATADC